MKIFDSNADHPFALPLFIRHITLVEKGVIILGGGIAGLTAARELIEAGWQVTIVEAKQRLGGRIHTVRTGSTLVELGAEFVHGESSALNRLLSDYHLTTHDVPDQNHLLRNGRLEPVPLWEQVGELIGHIDPRAPDESFTSYLDHAPLPAAQREIALGFVEGFNAADSKVASAHALRRSQFSADRSNGSKQMRVNAGYGALVADLASELRSRGALIRTGTTARLVKWKPGSVEVAVEPDETLRAAAAITTLPLGVLKSDVLVFEPSLPRKREAADALPFGNARKLALLFREAWWPQPDFGFVHSFSEALPTWWSDPRAPLLTGWAGGPKADALANHSLDQLTDLGLIILARIFGESTSAVKKQLIGAESYNWAHDPQIRGAYSYIPVRGLDLPKLLAEPVDDTLFFAGEATAMDAQMGTVFGAVESGMRAAKELKETQGSRAKA